MLKGHKGEDEIHGDGGRETLLGGTGFDHLFGRATGEPTASAAVVPAAAVSKSRDPNDPVQGSGCAFDSAA